MDPAETAKLVVPGLFALVGVLVGGLISYAVARANLQGQRQVANDNAQREHRGQQVRALRERVSEILSDFNFEAVLSNRSLRLWVESRPRLNGPLSSGLWQLATQAGLTDSQVRSALVDFTRDELACHKKLLTYLRSATSMTESEINELVPPDLERTLSELTREAEMAADRVNIALYRYVFGQSPQIRNRFPMLWRHRR